MRGILVALLVGFCTDNAICQSRFDEPIPIRVGEYPLDTELEGGAAPWVVDFDGDGVRDLIVGEAFNGRLRIYRNHGTDTEFQLRDFSLFQNGAPRGCVPRNNGFTAQIVDLDQDGLSDILTPAWHGMVYWFRQSEPGQFDVGRPLADADGNTISMEWTFGATAADWNADGKLDVIVGLSAPPDQPSVVLLTNVSRSTELEFSMPVPVLAAGKPINVTSSAAAPTAADWDGDGLFDILIGAGDGSVVVFRNVGVRGDPRFQTSAELIPAAGQFGPRGAKAKVCVVDWNLDGKLDLVVGDHGKQFEKAFSPAELDAAQECLRQQQLALASWGRVFRSYVGLRKNGSNPDAISAARQQLIKQDQRQQSEYGRHLALKNTRQYHGNVWVFVQR